MWGARSIHCRRHGAAVNAQSRVISALRSVSAERRLPPQDRTSGAADAALDWAIGQLSEAQRHLAAGQWEAADIATAQVARRAIDSWSLTSRVSEAVCSAAQEVRARSGLL